MRKGIVKGVYIICISDRDGLTLNKSYEVIAVKTNMVFLVNDFKEFKSYYIDRFILDKVINRDKVINNILDI